MRDGFLRLKRWSRLAFKGAALLIMTVAYCGTKPAGAVLIIGATDGNGNPTGGQNLSAPTDSLVNAWNLEGTWQTDFTGTPIAPNYFITAAHLGGSVGDTFVYNGVDFTTTAEYTPPDGSDLAIWQVSGTFSSYASINTNSNLVGQEIGVFGRSAGDGPTTAPDGTTLSGWQWSSNSLTGALSWGTNTVAYEGAVSGLTGQFIGFEFNKALGPNTAALSSGDSGGGVFVQNNGVWVLAGVNSAASGPYNTVSNGGSATQFNASLYDSSGLYYSGTTQATTGPSISFATSLSSEAAWINSIISVPEPSAWVPLGCGLAIAAPWVLRRRSGRQGVEEDA